jgi:hypothetical protein
MTIDDGGPAFPHEALDGRPDYRRGLSVRDYFAGQVLAAMTVNGTSQSWEKDAETAYKAADAMLAARQVQP